MLYHGWDIGGAHVKHARVDAQGRIISAAQYPCALWQGLDVLDALLSRLARTEGFAQGRHAVTMTGELCDLFATRAAGVAAILETLVRHLGPDLEVFSREGFLPPATASEHPEAVASMNWLATATDAAHGVGTGLLVDIGSTTTDLIPFIDGEVRAAAVQDGARLASGELVYTGVCRTPVMAVAMRAPFDGAWRGLAAEYFANMADVYRVRGELPDGTDAHPTADQRPADGPHSRARLARMLGEDASAGNAEALRTFADFLMQCQLQHIEQALAQISSRMPASLRGATLVGAGAGTFLVSRLAARQGSIATDYASLCGAAAHSTLNLCAPAVAVARLLGRARA